MLDLTLTLEADVTVGTGQDTSNLKGTLLHVPGSTLRGALASRWIVEHGLPSSVDAAQRQRFVDLFEGPVRYGPCLPMDGRVEPLGAWFCKYQPDSACRTVMWHEADEGPAPSACTVCDGPMVRGKGRVLGMTPGERTRTALEGEVASLGNLFSTRYLPRGSVLTGRIDGSDDWLGMSRTVWLGARRSTGGRARLDVTVAPAQAPPVRSDGCVLVRLAAPGIFVDDTARPVADFPLGEVQDVLGCTVKVERSWTRPTSVAGWHAASGLPKPTERAVTAGSEVLLRPSDVGVVGDPQALAALQAIGLGERQAEGFGWIEVNPSSWSAPVEVQGQVPPDVVGEIIADLDHRVQEWLRPKLKAIAERIELGEPRVDQIAVLGSLPTFRRLPTTAQERITDIVSDRPIEVMSDLVHAMEKRRAR